MTVVAFLYFKKCPWQAGRFVKIERRRNRFGYSQECDIKIKGDYVSSNHGSISLDGNTWRLSDFDSTNGTYLSGKRLGSQAPNPSPLNDGDVIQIGPTEIVFKQIVLD